MAANDGRVTVESMHMNAQQVRYETKRDTVAEVLADGFLDTLPESVRRPVEDAAKLGTENGQGAKFEVQATDGWARDTLYRDETGSLVMRGGNYRSTG